MTNTLESDPVTGIPGDHEVHHDRIYPATEVPFLWDVVESRVKELHEKGITGKGVVVSVMDTGYTPHPLLPTPIAKRNFTNDGTPDDVTDRNGHGNWCIGRILARPGSDGTPVGLAPGADLIVVKVLGDSGAGRVTWSQQGRVWAAQQGAHVNSVSIGGPSPNDDSVEISMLEANELGTLIELDAAGNSGYNGRDSVDSPGNAKSGLGVGSYRRDGGISVFSSGGPDVDVACPGEDVTSTSHRGSGWSTQSGTSMATPFCAGLMALTIDAYRQAGVPDSEMTGADFWRKFLADRAAEGDNEDGGQPGKDARFGHGKPLILKWIDHILNYKSV